MALTHRPDRVGDQIRQELSELLSRGVVHDPGIGFITLTRVKVTPDLQLARVYYTMMGDQAARRETAKALDRATSFFRRQVGARLQLRRVPEIEFRFDESVGHQDRIEQIIRELHEEGAQRAAAVAGSPEQDPASAQEKHDPPDTAEKPDQKDATPDTHDPLHTAHDDDDEHR
jgi:ribosome-binding factor A